MKVKIGEIDGKPIFGSESVSIQGALDAGQKLVEAYPEFDKTTDAEKKQILNIAMMNCESLRSIAPTSAINMTKGSGNETQASIFAFSNYERCISAYSISGGYSMGTSDWYIEENIFWAVARAVSETESSGHLSGGFEFIDGSGIHVLDHRATSYLTRLTTYYHTNNIVPLAAFVSVLPNTTLKEVFECAGSINSMLSPAVGVAYEGYYSYVYPPSN